MFRDDFFSSVGRIPALAFFLYGGGENQSKSGENRRTPNSLPDHWPHPTELSEAKKHDSSPRLVYLVECAARDSKPQRQVYEERRMTEARATDQERGGPTTPLSLLERARLRDEDAWSRLVALYRPLVLFWCNRAGLAASDAEDVAQEVLASVAGNLGSFRRDRPGDTFRGWLRIITRNAVSAHARRNKGRPHSEGGAAAWERLQDVADPLAGIEAEETAEIDRLYRGAVEQVRVEFEERTWQAFWLTAIDGRSPAALTEELGMSIAAIRQAKSRVLRRLKQEMGELLE
jgi:RNA polymerase sigma-70 factor (ECF subfamily)